MMLKKLMFGLIILGLSGLVYAQSAIIVPDTIKQNCRLTAEGGIDYCPAYRQTIRSKNRELANQWKNIYSSGGVTKLMNTVDLVISQSAKNKIKLAHATNSQLFMYDYELYIHRLFRQYIDGNSDSSQLISNFFRKTYYDTDQSGLGITAIKLYKGVSQYDTSIKAQVSVRNFSAATIDTIEDIYCFSTIGDVDFVYPLGVQSVFAKNSITNLVLDIPTKASPLLDSFGNKKVFCTLVYTQDGIEKYTNRGILDFDLKG